MIQIVHKMIDDHKWLALILWLLWIFIFTLVRLLNFLHKLLYFSCVYYIVEYLFGLSYVFSLQHIFYVIYGNLNNFRCHTDGMSFLLVRNMWIYILHKFLFFICFLFNVFIFEMRILLIQFEKLNFISIEVE